MLASKTTAASSPIMNFIVRPQLSLSGREARRHVMRVVSVLPVGYFVQMPDLVQIKFTSSVAGALHPPRPYPELEQDRRRPRSANGRFPLTVRISGGPILTFALPLGSHFANVRITGPPATIGF